MILVKEKHLKKFQVESQVEASPAAGSILSLID